MHIPRSKCLIQNLIMKRKHIQIGRGSFVAANSGTNGRNDSDHHKDKRRHHKTHLEIST